MRLVLALAAVALLAPATEAQTKFTIKPVDTTVVPPAPTTDVPVKFTIKPAVTDQIQGSIGPFVEPARQLWEFKDGAGRVLWYEWRDTVPQQMPPPAAPEVTVPASPFQSTARQPSTSGTGAGPVAINQDRGPATGSSGGGSLMDATFMSARAATGGGHTRVCLTGG